MHRCRNCNVEVDESQSRCPLCGSMLGPAQDSPLAYPKYKEKKSIWRFMLKTATFVTFAAIATCIFINTFTYRRIGMLWSIYVVLALALSWGLSLNWSSRRRYLPQKLFSSYLQLSVFSVLLDLSIGFTSFSTSFVVPSLSIALVLTYMGIMMGGKRLYKKFFGYMIFSFFTSAIPALCTLAGLCEVGWFGMLPLLVSILVAAGLFIFSGKTMKREMKKRFKL